MPLSLHTTTLLVRRHSLCTPLFARAPFTPLFHAALFTHALLALCTPLSFARRSLGTPLCTPQVPELRMGRERRAKANESGVEAACKSAAVEGRARGRILPSFPFKFW
jgi:hypothetical protein